MASSLAVEELKKNKGAAGQMSALEVAALGKNLALGETVTKLDMDPMDEDWQVVVSRAKSKGPGSWFASRVDFYLNGSHFLGKVGYSVEGGVIPLFDGAALDVSGAGLHAENPKKAEPDARMGNPAGYKNWVTGKDGLLVLAPVNADNVIPVRTGEILITERGLAAGAQKDLTFTVGNKKIQGERLDFSDQIAVLYGVSVEEDGRQAGKKYRTEAVIDGEGVSLFPALGDTPEDTLSQMPGRETSRLGNAVNAILDLPGPTRQNADAQNSEEEEEESGFLWVDRASSSVTFRKDIALTEEEEEEALWSEILGALKKEGIRTAEEAGYETLDAVFHRHGFEKAAAVFEKKWDQIKAIYDGFSEPELKESWEALPAQIKRMFRERISDEESIQDYLEKLVPTGPFQEFLGMKEEEEKETEEEEESGEIPLAEIPMFQPFLGMRVSLQPEFEFKAFIRGGAKNLKALWTIQTGDGGQPAELQFKAGIRGSLSLAAVASLYAQVPLILKGFVDLYAAASLDGAADSGEGVTAKMDSGEKVMLEADLRLPLKMGMDGSLAQASDALASLSAGLLLSGSVGVKAGLSSTLLMWKKNLVEKEFFKWDLARIRARVGVRKKPADSLFSGWSLDTACLAISTRSDGLGSEFLRGNTPERRYGLYDPEERESQSYPNIQNDFQAALALLKDFAKASEGGNTALGIPKDGESGLDTVVERMQEIQNRFICVWVDAYNEAQAVEEEICGLDSSSKFRRETDAAQKSLEKHTQRIREMSQWNAGANILEAYAKTAGKGGKGYVHALEKRAQDESQTYPAIVAYERKRYEEATRKHTKRIEMLRQMQENGKTDEEIRAAYEEEGGDRAGNYKSMFSDIGTLLAYEQGRLQAIGKKTQEKYDKTVKLSQKEDAVFFKEYAKGLTVEELLTYGTSETLLAYEEKRYQELSRKNNKSHSLSASKKKETENRDLNGLAYAGALIEARDLSPEEGDKGRQLAQFRNSKKGAGGRIPDLSEIFDAELYRTASIDDLIALETEEYVKGKAGKALETYLKQNPSRPAASKAQLKEIFGDSKAEAEKKFHAFLTKSDAAALIPYLTIEILLEYADLRRKKGKTEKERARAQREYQYLVFGRIKIGAVKGGEARRTEEEYIASYFNVFSDSERLYKEALAGGEQINLEMMMGGLSDGSENERLAMLEKAREDGAPDFTALLQYLKMGGDKEKINQYQKKKETDGQAALEDVLRFYQSRLAEQSVTDEDKAGHYERYCVLKEMYDRQAPYEEMAVKYREMGGGSGYASSIREAMQAGKVGARAFTKDEALQAEQLRMKEGRKKHMDRIALIMDMKSQGNSYEEILEAYEKLARSDGTGLISRLKRKAAGTGMVQFSTGFEKSLAKKKLTANELIRYEIKRKKEVGSKHAKRLSFLLDTPYDSDEILTAPLAPEEAREAKRKEYLEQSKRYKKSDAVNAEAGKRLDELLNRPGAEMKSDILAYEEDRRKVYEDKLKALMSRREKLEDMKRDLKKTISFCHTVANNLNDYRKNPEAVLDRISDFEKNVSFIEGQKERTEEMERRKQEAIAGIRENMEQARQEQAGGSAGEGEA